MCRYHRVLFLLAVTGLLAGCGLQPQKLGQRPIESTDTLIARVKSAQSMTIEGHNLATPDGQSGTFKKTIHDREQIQVIASKVDRGRKLTFDPCKYSIGYYVYIKYEGGHLLIYDRTLLAFIDGMKYKTELADTQMFDALVAIAFQTK